MRENYSGRIDPTEEEWAASEWTDLLKERYHLASLFTRHKVVLDSCCGTGFGTLNFIVPEAKYTVGYDVCESALNKYGRTGKYEFFVMDGRKLQFDANTFDIVLSLDAIEHLKKEDGLQYLSEIKRVCKKDGLIIGTTPLVIDDSLIPTYLEWNKFHLFMYTRKILRNTLKCFFHDVQIYEIFSPACPYFLFLCTNDSIALTFHNSEKVQKYLIENENIFYRSKISNYFVWAKMLFNKKRLIKAGYMVFKTCLLKLKVVLKGQ